MRCCVVKPFASPRLKPGKEVTPREVCVCGSVAASTCLVQGKEAPREYDRRVNIQTDQGVFCVASSRIVLSNPDAVEAALDHTMID
eukprot:6119556-Amphidinium_carterae.1